MFCDICDGDINGNDDDGDDISANVINSISLLRTDDRSIMQMILSKHQMGPDDDDDDLYFWTSQDVFVFAGEQFHSTQREGGIQGSRGDFIHHIQGRPGGYWVGLLDDDGDGVSDDIDAVTKWQVVEDLFGNLCLFTENWIKLSVCLQKIE